MKKIITICFLLIVAGNSIAQQITFQKTYGGPDDDYGNSVKQTPDGGYVIVGNISNDLYLIKTDSVGDTLWTKTYGGSSYGESGTSVQTTSDGGYIIAGSTSSFGAGSLDVYLIKTDSIGNLLWSKTFGGVNGDEGLDVHQTTNGGYIIVGKTESSASGGHDFFVIKTNSIGNALWIKSYSNLSNNNFLTSIQQTTDGGYIMVGSSWAGGSSYEKIFLIKIDSFGNDLWSKAYNGGPAIDAMSYYVRQTTDRGYIITGYTNAGGGQTNAFLIKTDSIGTLLWWKTYGGTDQDYGYSVQQTIDGGYIIAGRTYIGGNSDVYLIKTDSMGDTLWTKSFGGPKHDWGSCVQQTTDGGYIITGIINGFTGDSIDIYLIKTDSLGNSPCNQKSMTTIVTTITAQTSNYPTTIHPGAITNIPPTIVGSGGTVTTFCTTVGINETPHQEQLILFPNPFSDKISITAETNEPLEITLFDITSRKLLQQQFTNTLTLNTSHLSKGIYIYEVTNNKGVIGKGKVVKE